MLKINNCYRVLFALIAALSSTGSFAGNEGPNGVPGVLRPMILAQYEEVPGFMPPPYILKSDVTVYSDGSVEASVTRGEEGSVRSLLKLAPGTLAAFEVAVHGISNTQLLDENQGEPMCMDAPSDSIRVSNDGVRLNPIYERNSCHTFSTQDGNAQRVVSLMKAFVELSRMSSK